MTSNDNSMEEKWLEFAFLSKMKNTKTYQRQGNGNKMLKLLEAKSISMINLWINSRIKLMENWLSNIKYWNVVRTKFCSSKKRIKIEKYFHFVKIIITTETKKNRNHLLIHILSYKIKSSPLQKRKIEYFKVRHLP